MGKMLPPYKGESGHWITSSLFAECFRDNDIEPVFSGLEDKPGLINAKTTFVELGDPTGYKWAMEYLKSYQHWEALMKGAWFRTLVETWRRELHAKMRGEALTNIAHISITASSDTQRMQASKYLAERPYEVADARRETGKTRGRPSKNELNGKLKEMADLSETTQEEFARVGLKVVKKP